MYSILGDIQQPHPTPTCALRLFNNTWGGEAKGYRKTKNTRSRLCGTFGKNTLATYQK